MLSEREHEIVIGPDEITGRHVFYAGNGRENGQKHVHLDLTSEANDRQAEIERLLTLGARRVDVGQTGAESWTVLADPEGNEFCVIRPKKSLIG